MKAQVHPELRRAALQNPEKLLTRDAAEAMASGCNGASARAACDLLLGADGINSRVRSAYAGAFAPDLQRGRCRYVWLGTDLPLQAFTFIFERSEHGWFTVHAYRFDEELSTFIVECRGVCSYGDCTRLRSTSLVTYR